MKKAANEKSGSPLSGRLWKWLVGLAALCLAAYLVIWYMPHSEEVSWPGTAVEYHADDADYAAAHKAVIAGTYTWNRAGKRTFEGSFWIDGLNMDPGTRVRLTSESGGDQFYDASGQPVITPVYGVAQSTDGRGAAVWLWDKYTVDEAGGIHASFTEGQRFLCVGELSRQDAAALVDTVRYQ